MIEFAYNKWVSFFNKAIFKKHNNSSRILVDEFGLRPAQMDEYADYLQQAIQKGWRVTQMYDYPFSYFEMKVATRDAVLPASKEIVPFQVIVPEGIQIAFDGNKRYNGQLFHMNDQSADLKPLLVPCFSDVLDELRRRGVPVSLPPDYLMAKERESLSEEVNKQRKKNFPSLRMA